MREKKVGSVRAKGRLNSQNKTRKHTEKQNTPRKKMKKVKSASKQNFRTVYQKECSNGNVPPRSQVLAKLGEHTLEVALDIFRFEELGPFFNSLKGDTSLEHVSLSIGKHATGKSSEDATTKRRRLRQTANDLPILSSSFRSAFIRGLIQFLSVNRRLLTLELIGIQLPVKNLAQICHALSQQTRLSVLSLSHTPIGDEGFEHVRELAEKIDTLTDISVVNCNLTDVSASAISGILFKFSELRSFSSWVGGLRQEEMTDPEHLYLTRCACGHNGFTPNAVYKIFSAVKNDQWFKTLDLSGCELNEETIDLMRTYEFRNLIIDECDVDPVILEDIQRQQAERNLENPKVEPEDVLPTKTATLPVLKDLVALAMSADVEAAGSELLTVSNQFLVSALLSLGGYARSVKEKYKRAKDENTKMFSVLKRKEATAVRNVSTQKNDSKKKKRDVGQQISTVHDDEDVELLMERLLSINDILEGITQSDELLTKKERSEDKFASLL
ncbi:hypothetical protein PCE1_003776 [Barthelona sp. PCE]